MNVYTNKQIENSGNLSAADNPVCWQQHRRVLYSVSFHTEHIMWHDVTVETLIKEMYNLENKLQINRSYGTIEVNE